ncbi:hypothetical protein NON20_09575 [Synechocystis sp. B12]|uniref:hypothetical protein n=1 Tax=unclassified Synechocystis TaxID=2640012 RepID=UPI00059C67D3|nr:MULTISPECIES: hypothetical protein [unclassified Synechocystis]AVP91154.1 hypothetical protein C7I86_16625 [Synechocystis sp. IPPAS B-1465]MBD2619405.1 hypothetical protein [Synechocystis sp. FACHB-898]WLT39670.1 hypothetical protein NON20_09575 [Synechocystis sp. B12]NHL99674.1 hypothetical protein [Synechocystis sp. PCC 6803]QWO80563.1 hypothetical protein KBZ93_16540 [Synechocystis sp. PCC 6803]
MALVVSSESKPGQGKYGIIGKKLSLWKFCGEGESSLLIVEDIAEAGIGEKVAIVNLIKTPFAAVSAFEQCAS